MPSGPYVYIDTRGASKGLYRQAPNGVRVAVHFPHGVVELEANADGSWNVNHGPAVHQAGTYAHVASGSLNRSES